MSIGTRISNAKGVRQIDGATGVQIDNHSNDRGFSPSALAAALTTSTTKLSTPFTASMPGFYVFSGSLTMTGTIPAASSFPGSMLMFARDLTSSGPMMLTGSARVTGVSGVFSVNTAISGTFNGSAIGDMLTIDDGQGGLCLWSDGRLWIPLAASGSFTIA